MNTSDKCSVLKDVIAYVDVWSSDKTANYSKPFIQQLHEMGAQVSKTFNKQVTHVIFKNGHPATWTKAKKSQVKLVSVLWVDKCYDDGIRVDEELFPALNDESNPILKNKKHRCMQPKDSPERTPENDRRMRKKLDKMMKDLVPKQPLVTDVSPIIIDEENGIIYSPSMKRSDYMARRLKDMKEKRENLSLTASQMFESLSPPGLKPSLGSSPTVLKYMQSEDDCSASVDEPGYSPDKEEGRTQLDFEDHDLPKEPARSVMEKPWRSHCPDVFKPRTVSPLKCPSFEDTEEEEGGKWRKSLRKTQLEKNKSAGVLESPGQEMENSKKPLNEKSRSQINVSNPAVKKQHSPNKCERIKRHDKSAAKSSTETKICTLNSSAATSDDACWGEASPLPRKELKRPKRGRASISALVRSFSELKTLASGSADVDDDVFEDIFSQTNHHKKTQRSLLPVDRDIQIPLELEPVPKKRKQRSESAASESSSSSSLKKRKLEKGLTRRTQHSDANSEPEIHPQQDLKEFPAELDVRKATTALTAHRQSKLPFTKAIASHQKTHKTSSTCVRPETSAGPDPQKHSELYHTSESG